MGKIKYHLMAISACLGWGCAFAFIKLALEYMPTFQVSGIRFIVAGLILLPFLFGKNENWKVLITEWKFVLLFSFFQIFAQYSLYFYGIDLVPASAAAIIVGASPLVVFVMAHFALNNDRFTKPKFISVMLGVAGIVIMTLNDGDFKATSPYYLLGILLVFLSVLVNSYVNIVVAKNQRAISPIMLTAVSNFFGGLMLYLVSFCVEDRVSEFDVPFIFWVYLFFLSFITSFGFSVWFYLLKRPDFKVSEVNIWKFVIPVFGAVLSWLMFENDKPNVYSLAGILSITLAIFILQYASIRKK